MPPATIPFRSSPRRLRAVLVVAGKLTAVGAVGWYLVRSGGLRSEYFQFTADSAAVIACGVALTALVMFVGPLRHFLLLRAAGIEITATRTWRIGLIGGFFNNFLLGSFGGDFVRYMYAADAGRGRAAAAAATLVDRLIGLLSVVLLASAAAAWGLTNETTGTVRSFFLTVVAIPILGLIGLAATWWIGRGRFVVGAERLVDRLPRRMGEVAQRLLAAFVPLQRQPAALAAALVMSLTLQSLTIASIYLIGLGTPIERAPTLGETCFGTPFAFLANSLPLPGSGLGAGEAAFDRALRGDFDGRGTTGLRGGATIFLFWRCWTIVISLIALPLYLVESRSRRRATQTVPQTAPSISNLRNAA